MSYDFQSNHKIKATRKPHRCDGCSQPISVGEPADYFAGKYDGDFFTAHFHPECREAEAAWNDKNDCWGEDWSPLNSIKDCDEADDECAWLRETFPTVAERLGL